jgi:hypothetical protein
MATYRVRSTDGSNADDGSTWALAKADLHTATTGALAVASAAGDEIYVSSSHAQTTAAAITLTALGTAANPTRIIGCNDSADTPTAEATGASITTTGGNTITLVGFAFYKNINFNAATGTASASLNIGASTSPSGISLEDCKLSILTTGASGVVGLGASASSANDDVSVSLENVVFRFSSVSQSISLRHGRVRINGGSIDTGGSKPSILFSMPAAISVNALIENMDLSYITGSLVNATAAASGTIVIRNCKLAAGVAVLSGAIPSDGGIEVILDNCDSADTHSRSERYTYQGSILADTATYLTAMDGDSAASPVKLSQKMTTLASGASNAFPLILQSSKEIYKWNETVGSAITATVEILHDSATNLKDSEVWVEFMYMGTSGNPIGTAINNHKADYFGTAADHAAGTGAGNWTKSMTNPNSQKLSCTFTPQEKGYISARVHLAKANYTIYVHPDIVVS